jgi:hypothetical protein
MVQHHVQSAKAVDVNRTQSLTPKRQSDAAVLGGAHLLTNDQATAHDLREGAKRQSGRSTLARPSMALNGLRSEAGLQERTQDDLPA